MHLPERVELIEVGLRDGLQNQSVQLPTEKKLELIVGLVDAGFRRLQVTSFVNPKRVPQMADAEELCALLPARPGVVYTGLVLNAKGLERARAAGLDWVDMSLSASDTHSRRNTGMGFEEALEHFRQMFEQARKSGMRVRAGLQCAFGCAYEGAVPFSRLLEVCEVFRSLGVDEIALADSTGMANPRSIEEALTGLEDLLGDTPLVLHLHDTRGLGLANLVTALQQGVSRFDTALGGLGGCPFIEGASGNIASEDTLYLLDSLGVSTGVDRFAIADCSAKLESWLDVELPSKLYGLRERTAAKRTAGEPVSSERASSEPVAREREELNAANRR